MNFAADDFLCLLQACEDNCEVLYSLNKGHYLHQFSNRNTPANEHRSINLKVVNHFLQRNSHKMTDVIFTFEEVMAAYGHFCLALETSITIERAKTCSFH